MFFHLLKSLKEGRLARPAEKHFRRPKRLAIEKENIFPKCFYC
jgi:hypothetical protein